MFDDLVQDHLDPPTPARPRAGRTRTGIALGLTVLLGAGWLTARAVLDERSPGPVAPVAGGVDLDVQPSSLGVVRGELAVGRPLVRALSVRDRGPLALTYTISYRVRTLGPVDLAPLLHLRMFEVDTPRACSRLNTGTAVADSRSPAAGDWAPLVGGAVQADRPRLAGVTGAQVWCLRLELGPVPTPSDAAGSLDDAPASLDGAAAEVDLRFDAQQETGS